MILDLDMELRRLAATVRVAAESILVVSDSDWCLISLLDGVAYELEDVVSMVALAGHQKVVSEGPFAASPNEFSGTNVVPLRPRR